MQSSKLSSPQLIFVVCSAQLLGYLDASFWPALLPDLSRTWSLSNREAGCITAMHYGAYLLSAPLLLTLTDRVASKAIYLFGVTGTAAGALCFATVADGFWGAVAARALGGIGEAGRFMVGVKLLADHMGGRELSRGVAWNALTTGVAAAISYVCIDPISQTVGWRTAFVIAAIATILAGLIIWFLVPGSNPGRTPTREIMFDLRPVLVNRAVMAYVIAYFVHTFESVGFRSWVVAFLAYSAADQIGGTAMPAPTVIAMAMVLCGTAASFFGSELALRVGQGALVLFALIASAGLASVIGFAGANFYGLAVALVLAYGIAIYLDSAALTAGTSNSAEPLRRGTTLAIHSSIGYVGGAIGPVLIGVVLDFFGGMSQRAWGLAFLLLGVIDALGLTLFWLMRPSKERRGPSS